MKQNNSLAMRAALLSSSMLFLAAAPAQAQDAAAPAAAPAAEDAGPLGEILVTARRVTESASKVPIAISAVSADQLSKQMIYDSRSLMLQVPGLQQATRIPGNPVPTALTRIRGVTGIANYFNEAPYGAAAWSFYAPFFDVQGVEVLKGPQGTLFGQASNAGAIVIRPVRPGTEFGGYARVSVGNYNQRSVEGALDIPVIADKVFLRVSAKTEARDGWARDIYTGTKNGKVDYDIERATLVIKPSDTFENETMFQMEHVRDLGQTVWIPNDYDFQAQNSTPAQRLALSAQAIRNGYIAPAGTVNAFTQANGVTGDIAAWNSVRTQVLARQEQIGRYQIQGWSQGCPATAFGPGTASTVPGPNTNLDTVPQQPCGFGIGGYARNYAVINKTTLNLTTDLALKNIFSRTWGGNNVAAQDLDATKLIMQDSDNAGAGLWQNYPTTVSDELQLSGKAFGGALDFVTGVFYFESKQDIQPNGTYALNRLPGANSVITNNAQKQSTWAGYAQGNVHFTDRLTFTGGLRYTSDYAYLANYLFNRTTGAYDLQRVLATDPAPRANTARWKALSYTASVQYQLAPRSMIYLTNAKGFSSGGLQNVTGLEKFDPDSLNNIELGLKSTFRLGSDWQVRTDLAGFYGFYNNVKVTTGFYTPIPNTNPPATQIVIATTNGATARNWGFDADISAAFRNLFTIRGFVTHAKSKYTKFSGPVQQNPALGIVDLKDSPFPNSPPWKFGVTGSFNVPTSESFGDLSVTAQYTYTSEYWVTYGKPQTPYVAGDPDTAAICKAPRTVANGYPAAIADGKMAYKDCAPALDNVNLTVTWDNVLANKGLTAQVTVTNLLKNKTLMGITSGYDTALYNAGYPNLPRFVYVSLRKSF